jgi:hypothetical protein
MGALGPRFRGDERSKGRALCRYDRGVSLSTFVPAKAGTQASDYQVRNHPRRFACSMACHTLNGVHGVSM